MEHFQASSYMALCGEAEPENPTEEKSRTTDEELTKIGERDEPARTTKSKSHPTWHCFGEGISLCPYVSCLLVCVVLGSSGIKNWLASARATRHEQVRRQIKRTRLFLAARHTGWGPGFGSGHRCLDAGRATCCCHLYGAADDEQWLRSVSGSFCVQTSICLCFSIFLLCQQTDRCFKSLGTESRAQRTEKKKVSTKPRNRKEKPKPKAGTRRTNGVMDMGCADRREGKNALRCYALSFLSVLSFALGRDCSRGSIRLCIQAMEAFLSDFLFSCSPSLKHIYCTWRAYYVIYVEYAMRGNGSLAWEFAWTLLLLVFCCPVSFFHFPLTQRTKQQTRNNRGTGRIAIGVGGVGSGKVITSK